MNTIYIKEVTSSIMGKDIIRLDSVKISDDEYIKELNINSKKLVDIDNYLKEKEQVFVINHKINLLSKIKDFKKKLTYKKFVHDLRKIIRKNNLVGCSAIFSNDLKKKNVKKHIEKALNNFSINEYLCLNSIKENYLMYINEYMLNNNIKREEINIVMLLKFGNSLDFEIVEVLNDKYKEINIFCEEKISKNLQNKIKKINEETGSCIQILNRNIKDFRKYNVYIFLDKSRFDWEKYKFSKSNCYIDFTSKENDKFNVKYLQLEKQIKKGKYDSNKIRELYSLYGKITISSAILN